MAITRPPMGTGVPERQARRSATGTPTAPSGTTKAGPMRPQVLPARPKPGMATATGGKPSTRPVTPGPKFPGQVKPTAPGPAQAGVATGRPSLPGRSPSTDPRASLATPGVKTPKPRPTNPQMGTSLPVRPPPQTPGGVRTAQAQGGTKGGAPVRPTNPRMGQPLGAPTGPVGTRAPAPPQMLKEGGLVKKKRLGQGVDTVRVGGTPTFSKREPAAGNTGTKPRPPSRGKTR